MANPRVTPTSQWEMYRPISPPPKALSTLGIVAVALGVGVLGAYMLDLHSHGCQCGHRWRHLGAFNFGEERAHTCAKCGEVQWYKGKLPLVFRREPAPGLKPPEVRPLVLPGLPSGTPR